VDSNEKPITSVTEAGLQLRLGRAIMSSLMHKLERARVPYIQVEAEVP
jgi:hypothetical protein